MKIDPSKKWKCDGQSVSLLHRKPDGWPTPYVWEGVIADGTIESWTDEGQNDAGHTSRFDLVEDREPREWKASVRKGSGELYCYDEGDEMNSHFEIVRVREIVEP